MERLKSSMYNQILYQDCTVNTVTVTPLARLLVDSNEEALRFESIEHMLCICVQICASQGNFVAPYVHGRTSPSST